MTRRSKYSSLETRIASDDKRGIEDRWAYGRTVLDDPAKISATGKSLKHGAAEALIADANAVGRKLTEREIQYRLQCARAYKTINEIRRSTSDFDNWTALVAAGFPEVTVDESDIEPDDIEAAEAPDAWEQLTLIPGAPSELKLRGRQPLPLGEAQVGYFGEYCDQSAEMTANFAKRDALLHEAFAVMLVGCGGDLGMNAVEAYRRGLDGGAA